MMIDTSEAGGSRPATTSSRPPGRPGRLGTSGGFSTSVGRHIEPGRPHGYYIDLSSKADSPRWPPDWHRPGAARAHVVLIQFGLGCFERHLAGDGTEWLETAIRVGEHLVEIQQRGGRHDGGWVHGFPFRHTYRITPPWLSGMAQGEGASLLVRLHRQTGEERYAEAALRALRPMRVATAEGGAGGRLDDGFFPEEYPTEPPSHVLNGGIFGLWGCYDVAVGLDDPAARELAEEGIATLGRALPRYDTGRWSRYDLFPHPVVNVAHLAYHRLHIDQLRAMSLIDPDPSFTETAARFERYRASRLNVGRAFGRKALFRLLVPRNRAFAHRLPWLRGPTA